MYDHGMCSKLIEWHYAILIILDLLKETTWTLMGGQIVPWVLPQEHPFDLTHSNRNEMAVIR